MVRILANTMKKVTPESRKTWCGRGWKVWINWVGVCEKL